MEDLKQPKQQNKLSQFVSSNLENIHQVEPCVETIKQETFVGKDKTNDIKYCETR
jgi:hypothetical protein